VDTVTGGIEMGVRTFRNLSEMLKKYPEAEKLIGFAKTHIGIATEEFDRLAAQSKVEAVTFKKPPKVGYRVLLLDVTRGVATGDLALALSYSPKATIGKSSGKFTRGEADIDRRVINMGIANGPRTFDTKLNTTVISQRLILGASPDGAKMWLHHNSYARYWLEELIEYAKKKMAGKDLRYRIAHSLLG
jgi:hypothetical protein